MAEKTKITVQGVLELLEKGYTRTPKVRSYDENIGSIQEHFNLEEWEVKQLFSHPKLKNKKTKKPRTEQTASFVLVDEDETPVASDLGKLSEPTDEDVAQMAKKEEPQTDQQGLW